ncbi:MAG: Hpt domain-containing protein, partial [Spirochaetia bacterium]
VKIKEAVSAERWDEVRRLSHAVKGAARTLYTGRIEKTAEELEKISQLYASEDTQYHGADSHTPHTLVAALENEFAQVFDVMKPMLD